MQLISKIGSLKIFVTFVKNRNVMHTAQEIENAMRAVANPEKIKILSSFFKTGKGEYGENDIFIGVPVPVTRTIAKSYRDTPLAELVQLLHSPVHELRMAALLCMVEQFKHADDNQRTVLYETYLAHTDCINNWDLVDLSAAQIVGAYLEHRDHAPLYRLAQSKLLWEQRIAIVATWQWIRRGHFDDTLALADLLLHHDHDLIRKATGWMLREVGKKDKARLCQFLDSRYRDMPRTTLRYAIERFTPEERQHYMQK